MIRLIENELLQDEKVLWAGNPNGRLFTASDLYHVPTSILTMAFICFWFKMTFSFEAPTIFIIFSSIIALAFVYNFIGRFFYKAYVNRNTYYFVTDKRIIIYKDTIRKKVTAIHLIQLPYIQKKANSSGVGSIIFGTTPPFSGMYANTGMDFYMRSPFRKTMPSAFYDLDDAEDVYNLINEVKMKAHSSMTVNAAQM